MVLQNGQDNLVSRKFCSGCWLALGSESLEWKPVLVCDHCGARYCPRCKTHLGKGVRKFCRYVGCKHQLRYL